MGIGTSWSEAGLCERHIIMLGRKVSQGMAFTKGIPRLFTSPLVIDGVAMGTEGMKYSFVNREIIANTREMNINTHNYDAFVGISDCDKTMPGMLIAAARFNITFVMLYGGSALNDYLKGKTITMEDVFEAVGTFSAGRFTEKEFKELENSTIIQ
ncbi:MAG: dihydroxy-acid dehydratase [Candidatus Parvarchaeota archaeon]